MALSAVLLGLRHRCLLLALLLAFTLGSSGSGGRSFLIDLMQADGQMARLGVPGRGHLSNLANILLRRGH